jgi:predicted DCC family thiol-disulfide oxidoreductase YuxK
VDSLGSEGPVIFFDGECGLCDRFVKWLVRKDRRHTLRFAALQGDTAQSIFRDELSVKEDWSIKFVDSSGRYSRSDAALRAIAAIGGIWKSALAFLIVPRFIRDGVYRWIATHRYQWFGRLDSCLLPSPALKERFLP